MSATTNTLFDVGDLPPLGTVPARMYASVLRPERYGPPATAFRTEVVDVPEVPPGFVLVAVMAAGINYNNVWAALGSPVDVVAMRARRGAREDFHVGGSEGSGIVWKVGAGVRHVRVGDEVVLSGCRWDEDDPDVRLGLDPMLAASQQVWGYELNWGSFAQFTLVAEFQCHPKPARLRWDEAAGFLLTGATAYRQLHGWPPNTVKPGDGVLVWGGSGGLGSMAISLVNRMGGKAVAVVSSPEKASYCMSIGAAGTIDRTRFDHWGRLPVADSRENKRVADGMRAFGRAIWEILGENIAPKIVFEHPGSDTLPTSVFVCAPGGMVVICGATSGYQADVDLRYLWMRQKRLQGSHFANPAECRATTELVGAGLIGPCLGHTYSFEEIGQAHQDMHDGTQAPGNLVALVGARPGEAAGC
ncbi:crotonyl-CoA carboxylase/reductase [Micromonospora sp. NPDC051196]|uniref:crotonyl-CoA carboxylase/reductase n=1 Tax=Micromonospora sp. NPDC051196 TaxID=3155281 RepID=UPI00342F5F95